jgi:hypothetical protein
MPQRRQDSSRTMPTTEAHDAWRSGDGSLSSGWACCCELAWSLVGTRLGRKARALVLPMALNMPQIRQLNHLIFDKFLQNDIDTTKNKETNHQKTNCDEENTAGDSA